MACSTSDEVSQNSPTKATPENFDIATEASFQTNSGAVCTMQVHGSVEQMMSQCELLKGNADLRKLVATTVNTSLSSILVKMPKEMHLFSQQIRQVRDVPFKRLEELLEEGVVADVEEAERVMEMIDEQLFDPEGLLQNVEKELGKLKEDFADRTEGPGGLEQRIKDELKKNKHRDWGAALMQPLYSQLGRWFREDSVDPVAVFTTLLSATVNTNLLFATVGPRVLTRRTVALSLLIGSGLTVGATIWKQDVAGSCTDFAKVRGQIAAEKQDAEMLQSSCHAVHTLVAVLQNEFATLHHHQALLLNQKRQIKLLLENRLDIRRMSAERFRKFLQEQDMGHVAVQMAKHHIDGKAFLDTLTKTDFQKTLGITEDLDQRRLAKLQELAAEGKLVELSPTVAALLASIKDSLVKLEADAQEIKMKLETALQNHFRPSA